MSIGEYVKKGIERKSSLTEVMDRRQSDKIQEYENVKLETLIAEEKKKLQEASPSKIDSSQATNFATIFFAGRTPAEIKEIINSLTQEGMDKLRYMAESMSPNNFAAFRGSLQSPNTSIKDIVEIVKLVSELQQSKNQSGNDMSGMAKAITEAIRLGADMTKAQQPTNSQNDPQFILFKEAIAEAKATREEMTRQERSRAEREIADLKARPSGFDELIYNEEKAAKIKKVFGGADVGVANEFTLRKAEMDQTERLETRKLDWEEKKWEKEKDNEGNMLDTVKEILAGPAGEILKDFGSAGAARIRGNRPSAPNSQAQSPQIAKVKCPNCSGDFSANTQLSQIQCPLCGVQLQSGNQPDPQQEQPSQAPIQQPTPNPTQVEPSQTPASIQEKPVDQTVEAESPVEQITDKQ